MSYEDAFAAVPGVTVEWAHYCGSYQGRLVAKLTIEGVDGPRYVLDYYGSCSGCDAYEAEMPWNPTPEHLANFGRPYVEAALTLDEAINELLPKPGDWYDSDEREALDHILNDYPERRALLAATPAGTA
ncbi:hypothetical protein [uncultured Aquabacterium sp.]|uniref:hypothetical protein n=1 Tax=uncultured Aquabacterium sp. TaxID=158753 RepID=UPI0025DF3ECB|nr:hypothetical protein [uncultured Aquabacterium sp.]